MIKIKTIFSAARNKIINLAESTYELVQKKTQGQGRAQTPSTSHQQSVNRTVVKRNQATGATRKIQKAATVIAGLFLAGSVFAQSTDYSVYGSTSLVDTNSTSTSTTTINTINSGEVTNINNTTVNSTSANTNTNVNTSTATSTNVNTNTNINSGTMTNINQNTNSGTMTYNNNNVNSGTMTNVNQNTSTATSTNVNTNTNINSGSMSYTNTNINTGTQTNVNQNTQTGDMTNRNINTSTSSVNANNVNQNVNTGDMTNRNLNESTITQKVIQPPPTAIAPAMMSGGNADLCSTGTSGSVQTQIFGVSTGGTVRDLNCERLKLSKTLYDMGMKVAAVATMCQDKRVFDAMMAAGTPCPAEGKIGDAAREYWAANPDKQPKQEAEVKDDTYKKVGLGALVGWLAHRIFN